MLLATAAILIGFVILIWSADLFVAGAASIARNMGLSPIIIGLTIVSIGTSAPEILVSLTAAFRDAGELAIGNAIGSNIANIGLVLGATLVIVPMKIHPGCIRRELPVLLLVTLGAAVLLFDGVLSRLDGVVMLATLVLIMVQIVRIQRADDLIVKELSEEPPGGLSTLRAWLTFAAGFLLLIGSSQLLVWGATNIAEQLGVSQLIIGLTIVAVGTSLPELAATVAGALRGHTDIAVGNVIGSNLFNLLAVMAIPGLVSAEVLEPAILSRDYLTMTVLTLLLAMAVFFGRKHRKAGADGTAYIGRTVGVLLLLIYALYYYWLYQTR
ncbi:calcium/sodium antiporter [Kineobactrum sediminis]|uniref:Calcium/sodium antiporter n=1 Tax=Kineobactrum sediminis TaxID=1905677 RepID=A0A2N5Y3E0_9GAMM|nr:calcium/sodium antiporter [Kineobactrum sediminis]PLW82913.1 calcium/sodium antiporter [Kineobactrum sediminis]